MKVTPVCDEAAKEPACDVDKRANKDVLSVNRTSPSLKSSFASNQSVPIADRYDGFAGTALCYAVNPVTFQMVKVRALLDGGANASLVTQSLARKLGLSGVPKTLRMNVAGNQTVEVEEQEVAVILASLEKKAVGVPLSANTIESVGEPLQPIPVRPKDFGHIE